MKRITYVSRFSRPLSEAEIQEIGAISRKNNQRDGITGVLVYLGDVFFQIIEGEAAAIDALFARIIGDDRHFDITCLKTELHVRERMFSNWDMQTINLEANTDILIQPIKSLLQAVTDSHRILEKYTQPTIHKMMNAGTNPLGILPILSKKIVLFTDIMSFSTLTEKLPVEDIVILVNRYFTICTNIIVAHGGEVTKFMGDGLMAYFSAEQSDQAIQCSLDILEALRSVRTAADASNPLHMMHTGIGLAQGKVIEGNIGSALKMDYTILGDIVNSAARLEALTRKLPRSLIFAEEVQASAHRPWPFVDLGVYHLKGRQEPVRLFSIDDELTCNDPPRDEYDLRELLETMNAHVT